MGLHCFKVRIDFFRVVAGTQGFGSPDVCPGVVRFQLQSLPEKVIGILILIGLQIQLAGADQDHGIFGLLLGCLFE